MGTKYSGNKDKSSYKYNDVRNRGAQKRDIQHAAGTRHVRKKENKFSPLKMFLITLGIVLGVGMVVIVSIALPKYLKLHKNGEISFIGFVETIPETLTAEVDEKVEPEPFVDDRKYGSIMDDFEYQKEHNIFIKDATQEGVVTLAFCGDILFDDDYAVMSALKQRGGNIEDSISLDTLEAMRGVDIMVANNEFPYTERGVRQPEKQFTFRADYSTANYLNDMGVDVVILANNHVFDYGEQGLLDTLDTLDEVGVVPVGAGRNLEEAMTPVYYIINDIKIAIVAATDIERLDIPDTRAATETSPGVLRSWNTDKIFKVIEEAKNNSDFVITCIHWGTEKEDVPDYWQKILAPKLVEAGTDLIIGDHPHRLQGIYYFGDVPCIYSLGNYWFNGFSLDTGLVRVTIDKSGLNSFEFLPAVQSSYSTHLVYEGERDRILDYMRRLSPDANISSDGFVTKK